MSKTIYLSETTFKTLKKIMYNEAIGPKAPVFGKGRYTTDYSPTFIEMGKVPNLHTDRYKDEELDESWKNWQATGYDKNTDEYFIYISDFKDFMFGESGFLRHLSYVADRIQGPLHSAILDKEWTRSLVGTKDWKYSKLNRSGGDEYQCFYTTILKLYQNPAIWNDFFFNPLFKEYKDKYDSIRAKLNNILKTDRESYENNYKPLLPMEEYRELNFFMNEMNKETKKIEKGLNNRPDLYYTGDVVDNSNVDDFGEDEY